MSLELILVGPYLLCVALGHGFLLDLRKMLKSINGSQCKSLLLRIALIE